MFGDFKPLDGLKKATVLEVVKERQLGPLGLVSATFYMNSSYRMARIPWKP